MKGSNTYLIGKGPQRLLIDTGEGKTEYISLVKSVLEKENATLQSVLVTHRHPDHVGGIKDLLSLEPRPKVYKSQINAYEGVEDIVDGQKWVIDDTTVRAFHCPGHTQDHMAFVLEEEDAMFTGDNVLGHGTAVFEDLHTYIQSLDRMSQQVKGRGYPGHGAEIDCCTTKIKEYIAHRAMREKEVTQVLGRSDDGDGVGTMDIVKSMYRDVPESLYPAAERGILLILDKLAEEGKASHNIEASTWTLNKQAGL